MPTKLATAIRRLPWRKMLVAFICAWIALAPALAEARAGSSSRATSQGSRGSRTYESNGARPMERSMTPQAAPAQPQYAPRPAFGSSFGGGGFFSQHPFMSGIMGGFLGAGIAGMLFGHGGWGGDGISPVGSMFGLLLQFALIGFLIWLAVTMFRRRAGVAMAGSGFGGFGRTATPLPGAGFGGGASPPRQPVEIPISDADFNAWSGILIGIQGAWSHGDLAAMRRYVTPEMLSYFSEELSRNASQGIENRVENVTLVKGDLEEAWREGDLEYATARLRWSALDYKVRPAQLPGEHEVIVEGDPTRPVEASEVWTFVRSHSGGHWLLSAIQQV